MKLLVECSLKRTWRGNKIVKELLLSFCIDEWLLANQYKGYIFNPIQEKRIIRFPVCVINCVCAIVINFFQTGLSWQGKITFLSRVSTFCDEYKLLHM